MGEAARTSGIDRYELRVATDPSHWNSLVDASPTPYFSQLWEWGDVQRALDWEPWRLELVASERDGGACIAAAQLLVRRPRGIGWGIGYAPRGPVLGRAAGDWARFEAALTRWARDNRVATLVFDPNVSSGSDLGGALMRPPWRAAPLLGEPVCHVLDLLPEAALWANMRRKHREWIRRAERADVEVRWTDSQSSAEDAALAIGHFQQVYAEIAKRIGVPLMSSNYYELMWDLFRKAGRAHMVTASALGTPVGAMLHFTCGDEMIWFAGGQTADGARVGVGKLLVWRSLMRANELGSRRYNMWGTRTKGLAHFKVGFGARQETYIGTRSMAVNKPMDLLLGAAWQARQFSRRIKQRSRVAKAAGGHSGAESTGS